MLVLIALGSLAALVWIRYGLLPLRPLNSRLAGPDPLLERTLKAAVAGEWKPAAQLLTDAGKDWDRRDYYVQHLSRSAAWDGAAWLDTWDTARPQDPDVALIRACTQVELAWKARGARRASATSEAQFEAFHQALGDARYDLAHAADLNPEDPTPHSKEIWVALGLGYSPDMTRALWDRVTERAPHLMAAHHGMLQYRSRKWRGSHTEAREFAARAAQDAPPGSLLTVLPLVAWYEEFACFAEERLHPEVFRTPHLIALVDAAIEDAEAADGHPELPWMRHVLGYFLYRQGRYRAAVAQFRHVDGYIGAALPWRYSAFPKLHYRLVRTRTMWGALLRRR
ncbi:hypothetical protein [Streptomyces sp. NPDC054987]